MHISCMHAEHDLNMYGMQELWCITPLVGGMSNWPNLTLDVQSTVLVCHNPAREQSGMLEALKHIQAFAHASCMELPACQSQCVQHLIVHDHIEFASSFDDTHAAARAHGKAL